MCTVAHKVHTPVILADEAQALVKFDEQVMRLCNVKRDCGSDVLCYVACVVAINCIVPAAFLLQFAIACVPGVSRTVGNALYSGEFGRTFSRSPSMCAMR